MQCELVGLYPGEIPEEVIERVEGGMEGEYVPEYLIEPEHIREGLAEA